MIIITFEKKLRKVINSVNHRFLRHCPGDGCRGCEEGALPDEAISFPGGKTIRKKEIASHTAPVVRCRGRTLATPAKAAGAMTSKVKV
jgi:hypothetical protein